MGPDPFYKRFLLSAFVWLLAADVFGGDNTSQRFVTNEHRRLREISATQREKAARQAERRRPLVPATFEDVAYGDHEKQRFDLWVAAPDRQTPLVIYIHGGGFRGGDKRRVNGQLIRELLSNGIAFASINYRLTDVGPYPMPMHDCARGLQTIRHRAHEFNIDPARIGVMGGSAGAGISQWLAFHDDMADPDSTDPVARQSTRVSCAVPANGQCSYDPRVIGRLFNTDRMHNALPAFYGMDSKAEVSHPRFYPLYEDASPITHLSADDPPVFLYYSQPNTPLPENSSGREYIHHPKFGFYLKERMDALGIECVLRLREQSSRYPQHQVVAFFMRHLNVE